MRRLFCCLILALACVIGMVRPASATSMTIAGTTIPNWRFTNTGAAGIVYLEITVDQTFTGTDLIQYQPWQPNAGPTGGGWRRRIPCTVSDSAPNASGEVTRTLSIPAVIGLQSTVDAPIGTKNAKYVAYFTDAQGRYLAPYEGFTSFRVPAAFATGTTGTWSDVRSYNTGPSQIYYDLTYFSQTETLRLINEAVASSSGIASVNALTGPALTLAGGSNIQVVSGGSTITTSITGQIPIANGGTNAATAAGARTNLGAAASGANSDITSLSALSTPLSGAQGGTGIASYTIGDLLYASGASSLSKLNAVGSGQVLASAGVGVAPTWTGSPTLTSITTTNMTVSGLTSGRVTFAGASGLLTDDSNLLFDGTNDRLSVGTTNSTNTINMPNAGYLSGRGSVAAAQVKIASISDQTRYTGAATSATVDAITLGSSVPVAHVYTDGGAAALNPLAPDNQIRVNGIRVGFGTAGAYNDSSSSNVFHFSAQASNVGSANTVAGFFEAQALGSAANVWAINPVAYVNVGGTTTASAIMFEGNFGALGVSPNQAAYGIVLASNVDALTPAGTVKSFFQMQANTATSGAVNGIVFSDGTGQAVTNAQIYAQGTTATYAGLFTLSSYATGFDFAQSTFSSGSQIRLANGGAASSGIRAQNNANSANFNVARITTADYLEYGDGTTGLGGMRFLVSASSAETLRFLPGATGLPGNAGWNQSTPTAQQHTTAIIKRALTPNGGTPTVNVVATSPVITGTNTAFLTDLAPGSSLEFDSQAGTLYTVLSVASDTSATLTAPYGGTSAPTATAKTDYRTMLFEGASGDAWMELSNQHVLRLYGDSSYSDLRGMLTLVARATPAKRLTIGINDASSYAYISSFQESVGWKPLFLQAGAAGTAVGGVVIGTASPSSFGAMLKVEGAQTNPGTNNVGSEFNNLSTSNAYWQKISAQYLSAGSWLGPNIGLYVRPIGATDASAEDVTNVPIVAFGGKNYFGPDASQVVTPAPPVNLFTAVVDVYGVPTDDMTKGATHYAMTSTSVNVAGNNTTWNTVGAADRVRPGTAVQFASESTTVFQVATVVDNVTMTLTGPTSGTSGNTQMRADPYLLRARNSFGTERFRVESSGFTKITGPFVQNQGATIATVAGALTTPLADGNFFIFTGNNSITNILTDSSEAGKVIYCVFTGTGGLTDGSNLKLNGNFAGNGAGDAFDSITLISDGTEWIELARSVN